MLGFVLSSLILPIVAAAFGLTVFLAYIWYKYAPIVGRIFDEPPMFAPARVAPESDGEEVRFATPDGLELAGTYLPARTEGRAGVIVFCPEYLGDRWSALLYADGLREAGFDIFTFDFRNHGDSLCDSSYRPLQWVSDLEVIDLKAALAYVRSRSDADPAGVALFGMSRGGGTALCVGAEEPTVWAVATDGAFPTHGTMYYYTLRWARIYVGSWYLWEKLPKSIFSYIAWAGRMRAQYLTGRDYPSLEKAVKRIAPRPWLMIHGERDAYIGEDIAMGLFARAGEPKTAWIVPGAKHNRCQEADADAYRERIVEFIRHNAPRRLATQTAPSSDAEPRDMVSGRQSRSVAAVTSVPV